jgi:hypothetical protein
MAQITADPRGITLPYSSLFNVTLRAQSTRLVQSRPAEYFWKKATTTRAASNLTAQEGEGGPKQEEEEEANDDCWLDPFAPAISDSQHENPSQPMSRGQSKSKKTLRFTRLRTIAFKAFSPNTPDPKPNKRNIVTSTEVFSHQKTHNAMDHQGCSSDQPKPHRGTSSIFKSWKFKSSPNSNNKTHVKKMVVVLKHRISASSPRDQHPKTWEDYNRLYANVS